jgi:hypothetical protein
VGAELFHAVGRTNIKELIVAFRNFANAPNKNNLYYVKRMWYIKLTQTVAPLLCRIISLDSGHVIWDACGLWPVEHLALECHQHLQRDCILWKCPNGTDVEADDKPWLHEQNGLKVMTCCRFCYVMSRENIFRLHHKKVVKQYSDCTIRKLWNNIPTAP